MKRSLPTLAEVLATRCPVRRCEALDRDCVKRPQDYLLNNGDYPTRIEKAGKGA